MSRAELNEEVVFDLARRIEDPAIRKDYVDQACANDLALKARVNELLKLHDEQASFLESPPEGLSPTIEASQVAEKLGQTIGPYKIREQIGDGGMGVVYVAEQEKPLRRKVALKVIKPGMDSKAVLARFDAERNALALMNHPNIAKVLDAGTTEQGHPYFVMELIQGKPITDYCDERQLTINQRLELFTRICNAVQHAHQKGVIHRDLKPSNILVTDIDGKPVPKVIDFGVAKALGANLTDRTVYTSFQSLVGTPLYMSPEQAQLSGVDVDTSSDVYSLGILLYELLTGTTPLSPEELKQAAQDEVLRRIRETEPPRPSNRISSLGETSPRVSACRGTQPEQLGRLVRGDLDWIAMKALEKDRNRRYKTADAFAADIGRHLADEPVEARPPSTAYRLSRFYRRNKVAASFVALLLSLLTIAVPVTSIGWRRASIARREAYEQRSIADQERIRAEQEKIKAEQYASELRREFLGHAIAEVLSGDPPRADPAIQKAKEFGVDEDTVIMLEALKLLYGGEPKSAKRTVEPLLAKDPNHVAALCVTIMSDFDADNPAEYYRYQAQLQNLSRPPQDDVIGSLLLSHVALYRNPNLAFDITRDLFRKYPYWPTLRALYGSATIQRAVESPDDENRIEQFEAGVRNLELATRMVPANEFVSTEYLVGLTYAIELGDSLNDERTSAWRDAVERLIEDSAGRNWQNRRFENYRLHYLASVGGDLEKLREEFLDRGSWERSLIMKSLRFYGDNDLSAFSKEVGSHDSGEAKLIGAFREIEKSEDPKETASKVCDELFSPTKELSLDWHHVAINLLLFAGDPEAARKYAKQALDHERIYADRWTLRSMEYLADPTAENEERLAALAGPFRVPQAYIETSFGMQAVAEGNRSKAISHFEKALATGKLDWFSPCIADAMLRRMKTSKDWPSWIQWKDEPGRP